VVLWKMLMAVPFKDGHYAARRDACLERP